MAATTEEMESSAEDLEATPSTSATPNEQEDAAYEDAGFAADKTGWKVVTSRKTKKKERAETAVQPSQQENHPSGGQCKLCGGLHATADKAWGYAYPSSKGERLHMTASDLDLTLITDPEIPTRCGTSTCRDTTPDLTFVRGIEKCGWYNSGIDLGSDHYILRISAELPGRRQREYKLIDWDKFRKIRTQPSNSSGANTKHTIASWTEQLKADIAASERTITTDVKVERMDSRLANLLEAKHSILARWKGQRFNRRLRKKLAELNRTIEEYCVVLSRQQWDEVCNTLNGQMRKGSGWRLIKHLLDENGTKSKSMQRTRLSKLVHCATQRSTAEELVQDLAKRYLPLKSGQPSISQRNIYDGAPNSELDADYTESEVRFAIHELNSNSAAGPDGVTNRALRNLDDNSVTFLTQQINEAWKTGRLPGEWKHANTVLIPKPGKPLGLSNLRPISLTSCIGKLAEHVILNRLSEHVEEKQYFPYTMIGYRPGLSTQDAMLRIKKSLLDRPTRDTKALLGLDVEQAFDNIRHQAILTAISEHNLGTRFYQYVNAFLEDRTATLRIGEHVSQSFDLGDKGTPQGSVLSPFLFNLAMAKLSRALGEIADVEHTIYADDVTIWSTGGSDAELEARMQEAISVTEAHLTPMGLRCSSRKSELLIYHPPRRGRPSKDWRRPIPPCIELHDSDGKRIPTVDKIRILGLIIQSNGSNLVMLESITFKIGNALRMFRRIMNRHRGLGEDNAIRMVHAFARRGRCTSAGFAGPSQQMRPHARSILRFAFWLMTVTYSSSELSALSSVSMRVASLSLETQFRFLEAADADADKSGGRAGNGSQLLRLTPAVPPLILQKVNGVLKKLNATVFMKGCFRRKVSWELRLGVPTSPSPQKPCRAS
ncbi:uncharacterized protein LOC119395029 [Rhipicephalus sanguineus]|uniref:uncharacterized protein LOC119395029 n=1 Tax=Rhipicephalus sanguineus TaxID=34632 RepID=UPI001895918D|nr:uncharacterized protein LOC119395029 [Rhipicephalus sanguineus]